MAQNGSTLRNVASYAVFAKLSLNFNLTWLRLALFLTSPHHPPTQPPTQPQTEGCAQSGVSLACVQSYH